MTRFYDHKASYSFKGNVVGVGGGEIVLYLSLVITAACINMSQVE